MMHQFLFCLKVSPENEHLMNTLKAYLLFFGRLNKKSLLLRLCVIIQFSVKLPTWYAWLLGAEDITFF